MMSRIIALRPFADRLEEETHEGCAGKGDLNGYEIYDAPHPYVEKMTTSMVEPSCHCKHLVPEN
jgi:hypothetical protein